MVPAVADFAGGAVEHFATVAPPTAAIPLVGVPLYPHRAIDTHS